MIHPFHSGHYSSVAFFILATLGNASYAMASSSNGIVGTDSEKVHLTLDLPLRTTQDCSNILGYHAISQCVKAYSSAHEMARTNPPEYASQQQCTSMHPRSVCSMDDSSHWVPAITSMQMKLEGTVLASVVEQAQKEVAKQNASSSDPSILLTEALLNESPSAFSITQSMPMYGDMDATPPLIEPIKNDAIRASAIHQRTESPLSTSETTSTAAVSSESGLGTMVAPALAGAAVATALQSGNKGATPQPAAIHYGGQADRRYDAPHPSVYKSSPRSTYPTSTVPTSASRQNTTLGNTLRQNTANNDDRQHAASTTLSRGNVGSSTAARQGWGSDNRSASSASINGTSRTVDMPSRTTPAANDAAPKATNSPSAEHSGWRNGYNRSSTESTHATETNQKKSLSQPSTPARQGWGGRTSNSASKSSGSGSRRSFFGSSSSKKR